MNDVELIVQAIESLEFWMRAGISIIVLMMVMQGILFFTVIRDLRLDILIRLLTAIKGIAK